MATRVRIPVRVRLVGALPGDPLTPERVGAAVHDAVSAALAQAPLAALGAVGPGDVVAAPPTVVAEPGREDVLVPEVLAAALEGARGGAATALRLAVPARTGTARRGAGPPAEPFDPTRVVRRNGRAWYRIPFFDGGDAHVPLDEGTAATARPRPALPSAGEVLTVGQALDVAWSWHLYRSGPRWAPATLGRPGYYGLVRVGGGVRRTLIWVHEVRGAVPESGQVEGSNVSYLWWPLVMLSPERAGEPQATARRALDPTFGYYELSPTGEAATLAAVEAKIEALVEQGGYPAAFPLRDPDRRRAYAEELLRDEQRRIVENDLMWMLLGGPTPAVAILPTTVAATALEGPIRFVTAGPHRAGTAADGAGTGGGAGTGTGTGAGTAAGDGRAGGDRGGDGAGDEGSRQGGALGQAESGTTYWPVTGVTRERMPCGPYLAEPRATQLVADHGLLERMQRLIADLEMRAPTEDCGGYLGQFALNAAATVAGLARGIGLGAVRATSTTNVTVRTDGRGNNGFLDIRPGASPEFDYLRRLAGLARQVSSFGSDVVSCYLDPRNAGLVRVEPDWEPNAAAWALRFAGAFGDAMIHGYAELYAETCRALLLQQLRTSRQGIVARKDRNFEATLQAFTSALDILGETVVEMSTLKRAIQHAEQVFATGPVREVLSIRRTVRSRGEVYELPPPIDSVAPKTVQALSDARIERRGSSRVAVHQGRDWTTADLDSAIGLRRALLNQVDPLFLQVSDLDALFVAAQRDPGHPRRYLTDLLTEMLRANTEMTDDSSDPEDGGYFALEASQYVAREGGRDWRGLEYELHGIHGLADEQLRTRVGDDPRYAEGINRAIGRKANFDRFLTLFATVGIIALGLLCAPLGAVAAGAIVGIAGLALTVHDVLEADRMTDLYRALENPELFLKWQEVQLAQLMAALSIAFSVFDVVGVGKAVHALAGGLRQTLRVAERAGVGMGVRSAARSARRALVRDMTQEVFEQAAKQAVTEAAVVAAMSQLLPLVITPVLVPWMREQALLHGTLAEVDAALGPLAAGLPAPRASVAPQDASGGGG